MTRFSGDPPSPNTPNEWRKWAKEVRAIAATLKDEEAKRKMIGVAEAYEQLADREDAKRLKVPPAGRNGT